MEGKNEEGDLAERKLIHKFKRSSTMASSVHASLLTEAEANNNYVRILFISILSVLNMYVIVHKRLKRCMRQRKLKYVPKSITKTVQLQDAKQTIANYHFHPTPSRVNIK